MIFGSLALAIWHVPVRSWPALLGLLVLLGAVAYARGELQNFQCPRCHKPFFFIPRIAYPIFLQSGCANCGLPKHAQSSV